MTFNTLNHARSTTRLDYHESWAKKFHFVKLLSGKWCRTLGAACPH